MKHTQKFLQKRKFMMVLPVLVVPFLTVIFWALGGGQATPAQTVDDPAGLNLDLPNAHFNEEDWNKLTLYEQAEQDSINYRKEQESDPYALLIKPIEITQQPIVSPKDSIRRALPPLQNQKNQITDPNEININQKLEQLDRELNQAKKTSIESHQEQNINTYSTDPQFSSDVKQLETMMEMMNKESEADPEMEQVNQVMDKILDIQHPERVQERMRIQSEQKKGSVFPVKTAFADQTISSFHAHQSIHSISKDSASFLSQVLKEKIQQNSFYGIEEETQSEETMGNAIEATIHDTQEIVTGSTVKMRLQNDIYVDGKLIPKDQFIYGIASINGERLAIAINSIRDDHSVYPVSLIVYDLDGIEGIYIPGAITREVAKESSDQAIQSLQFLSMDQSLSTQAASAGLQAAKGLFSKKVKLISRPLKSQF